MKRELVLHKTHAVLRLLTVSAACVVFLFQRGFSASNSGAAFLKIPVGAEPAALGQAYTASAHGINALNWNPAGIVRTPNYMGRPTMGISLSHQDQFSENNLDHLGMIIPGSLGSRNSYGLDLIRLSYAEQDTRDSARNRTGSFQPSDLAIGAAFAHNFGPMQLGTQLKFIRQELAGSSAQGFAADLGLLSQTGISNLSLGLAARNVGPRMKFSDDSYDLPLTLSLGTAYRLRVPLTIGADVHYKPYQHQTVFAIGSQLFASNNVTLRAGYLAKLAEGITNNQKSETNRGNIASIDGLAGGIGLQFQRFNIDYSITPFGELGNTQMLTLSTWFGNQDDKKKSFETRSEPEKQDNRQILVIPIQQKNWWE